MIRIVILILSLAFSYNTKAELDCEMVHSTVDMRFCLSDEVEEAKELLIKYESAVRSVVVGSDAKVAFSKASESFILFVENDCNAIYKQNLPGTIAPLTYLICKKEHYQHRMVELWNSYLYHYRSSIGLTRPRFE